MENQPKCRIDSPLPLFSMKTKHLNFLALFFLCWISFPILSKPGISLNTDPFELSSAVPNSVGESGKTKDDVDFSKEISFPKASELGQELSSLVQPIMTYLLAKESKASDCKPKPSQIGQSSLLEELLFGPCQFSRYGDLYSIAPHDLNAYKKQLTNKNPILVSFLNYENFAESKTSEIYSKESGSLTGLTPLVLVGYDIDKSSFKAWRPIVKQSEDSFVWISFPLAQKLIRSAYFFQTRSLPNLVSEKEAIRLLEKNSDAEFLLESPNRIIASQGDWSDRVRVQWNSVPNAIGYEVFRKRKTDSKFQSAGLSRGSLFEDLGVQRETAYVYQVQAISENGRSKVSVLSNEGYASPVSKDSKKRIFITGLKATTGNYFDRVELTWDLPSSPGLEVTVFKWSPIFKSFKSIGKTNKTSFSDPKASKTDIEVYRVGVESTQESYSNMVTGYTRKEGSIEFQVEKPTVSKGQFRDKVTLSWKPLPGAINYLIFKRATNASPWKKLTETDSLQWEDKEEPLSTGEYSVSAVFEKNRLSIPSTPDKGFATMLASKSLASPTPESLAVQEDYSKQTVNIQWKSEKVDSFQFYFRELGSNSWKKWKEVSGQLRSAQLEFPESNELIYVTMISKSEGFVDSAFAQPTLMALYSPLVDTKKARAFGESPISKFSGPWTAMYWDGKSSVRPITLEILSDEFSNSVELRWNQKSIFKGRMILEGTVLEESGKWKISVSPDADAIQADVSDKGILPEKARLSFVRE